MKRFYFLFLLVSGMIFSQEKNNAFSVDVDFFSGNIFKHSNDLSHLVTGHPNGLMISLSKKTFGNKEWEQAYNYPDYGVYFLYEDYKNNYLGNVVAFGGHYDFYFWKRQLQTKIALGAGMVSNPYDKVTNNKNGAFGSKFNVNINFGLEYKKQNLIGNFGFQTGFLFTHFSNGRIKTPNSGINTFNFSAGINYNFNKISEFKKDTVTIKTKYNEPLKYNFMFRSGVNESPVINSGQHPFYHISAYADKRFNRKSSMQFGAELFLTTSFKDFIYYQSQAYPSKNINPNTDYKKIGVFIGHELFINKVSLETQIGYYVYQPYKFDFPIYDRIGIKYYFTKNIFSGVSVKTHAFFAEAIEFGVGVRL